jgi:hypothetical protein
MGQLIDQDAEHLRLLTVCYYINAALQALFSCFALIYVVIGAVFLASPGTFGAGANAPPAAFGYIFAILGTVLLVLGLGFAACLFFAGRFLSQRKHRLFCLVIAGINCLFFPYGTALGVFTFIVLMRPSAQALFSAPPPAVYPAPPPPLPTAAPM